MAAEAAYRVGRVDKDVVRYISRSLNIRELVAWLEGWEAKLDSELPQLPA